MMNHVAWRWGEASAPPDILGTIAQPKTFESDARQAVYRG